MQESASGQHDSLHNKRESSMTEQFTLKHDYYKPFQTTQAPRTETNTTSGPSEQSTLVIFILVRAFWFITNRWQL